MRTFERGFVVQSGCLLAAISGFLVVALAPASASAGGLSNAGLTVEVETLACGELQVHDAFRVTNIGDAPIALSDIQVKMWVDDTTGAHLIPDVEGESFLMKQGRPVLDILGLLFPVRNVTASATSFATACGPDAHHQANWEVTLSTSDGRSLYPGESWTGLGVGLALSGFRHFSPGTDTWFSSCVGHQYATDSHYAVYLSGELVFTSTGVDAPDCRAPHGTQQLTGYFVPPLNAQPLVGPVDPSTVINLAVSLPVPDLDGLRSFVYDVADRTSPNYRHFLTPDEFDVQFAPSAASAASLLDWAASANLTNTTVIANTMVQSLSGSAEALEQALYVNFNAYLRPDGTTFYATDRNPSLDLGTTVLSIAGLDDFGQSTSEIFPAADSGGIGGPDFASLYTCTPDGGGNEAAARRLL